MPTATPGSKILATGANGYIPIWVVRRLLEKGYSVRGTVRTAEKAKYLEEYFGKLGYGEKLEVVVVEDITKEGAFDEAVKGVDAIEHIASPFHHNVDDPQEFINPAVNGTLGILKSALKNAPDVKRIVITSSCAAILTPQPPTSTTEYTFSEKDWNEASINQVNEKGRGAASMDKYRASKTLAEKAAWKFYNEHKDEVKWDLAVVNPPFVFGPAIQEVSSASSLNTSAKSWYDTVVAPTPDQPKSREALAAGASWVDVRDLADAHVLALEKEEAGGERVIISAGAFVWQDWVDAAHGLNTALSAGYPDLEKKYLQKYDTTKAQRLFGIKFRGFKATTRDTLKDFEERGWLN